MCAESSRSPGVTGTEGQHVQRPCGARMFDYWQVAVFGAQREAGIGVRPGCRESETLH